MEKISKIITLIKENKWIHYAIIIIIGIILAIPLFEISIRETHDGSLHFLRMFGTVNSFKIGELPPIIAPYFCNGGGYAMNLFYNPIVTYGPLLIKLFTSTYMIALKIFAGLTIILSGITMYQFMYKVTKKRTIAIFSAIFYMIAPYKLGCVYRRYAIGEFTAFIFIPILFSGLYNLFNQDGKKHYLIAIGAIGLLLSHTITAFYMAIFSAIYILLNFRKLKEKSIILKIAINAIFIVLICLFFILPMFEAKQSSDYAIFNSDLMSTNGDYVYSKTIEPNKFIDYSMDKYEDVVTSIGVPILVLLLLTFYAYKKIDNKYKQLYITSILFCIITVFMCTKLCPWFLFPNFLCKLQYPWRMLSFFNFFSSIIVGINIFILLKNIMKKDIIRFIVFFIFIVCSIVYTIPIMLQFKTQDKSLETDYETEIINEPMISHFKINREYLSTKALGLQFGYLKERDYEKIYVLEGNADIINEIKENLCFTADVVDAKKDTVLEFPFFYYPGYQIEVEENGQKIKLNCIESENGFISCKLDKEITNAKIEAKYVGTTITYASYTISFISFIGFIVYIVLYRKKQKN